MTPVKQADPNRSYESRIGHAEELMDSGARDGELPQIVRVLFPTFGAPPHSMILTGSIMALARRQPRLFDRLGPHRTATYFVDPTDLAFAFTVVLDRENTLVRVVGNETTAAADVVIRRPILMLLGPPDGDALFSIGSFP